MAKQRSFSDRRRHDNAREAMGRYAGFHTEGRGRVREAHVSLALCEVSINIL